MLRQIGLYWHTLRHLRPVQFYGRLWFRLARPRPNLAPAPAVRAAGGPWREPARREPSLTGPQTFLFLGVPGALAEVGWDGPEREKLWRYNQHSFDDLNARDSIERRDWHHALLANWAARNPPSLGNGWEPYPTSLRIVNWVKWAMAGNALPEACVHSLAVQARWLAKRLEIHLLGNHLFANAKALVFAGLFFEGAEAAGWLQTGLRVLARELPEQVLADGGHFERSTMYHALALEDLLDLCNLGACLQAGLDGAGMRLLADWRRQVPKMRAWLQAMRHPDGEIAFFNDAAIGIAPSPAELDAYADRLGLAGAAATLTAGEDGESGGCSVRWLRSSGYARLTGGDAVALLDLAPVGPDYLPGHAHADTLSFEVSVGQQRLLVNSGTSCYGLSAERQRQRGTAAHNTVVVNGLDSSEVWAGFRVARRAYPLNPEVRGDDGFLVRCAHDGFRRLLGAPVHERCWRMNAHGLTVADTVHGDLELAEARFHFHPDVALRPDSAAGGGVAELPDGRRVTWRVERGVARIEETTWHPRFGERLRNACLVVRLEQGRGCLRLHWGPAGPES